ncbi:MAG: hypothetical protein FWF28_06215, partial [Micrococcales bacterium]|nr:hypothetical protein [Micrococcales bacterium]
MATTSTPVDRLAQAVNAAAQMQIDRQVLHVSALRTAIGAHTFATALEHSRSMALAAAVDAVSTFLTHVVDMELSEGQGDLL